MKSVIRTAFSVLAGVALCGVALANRVTAQALPIQMRGVTVEQKLGDFLPLDVQIRDTAGDTRSLGEYFDGKRPVIFSLNYSDCPVLCSVQLNALSRSLEGLSLQAGDDFRILTVSIDPSESVERNRETEELYRGQVIGHPQIEEGWHFATAGKDQIAALADAVGFRYKFDSATGQYNHPAMLAYVSPSGRITSYSLRLDFPPEDVRYGLLAAGEGKVGSAVDQIIMWCLSYDPEQGRYTAEAWALMRLGAVVTVITILGAVIPYWWTRGNSGVPVALDQKK